MALIQSLPYCNIVANKFIPLDSISVFLRRYGINCIVINFDNVIINQDLTPYITSKPLNKFIESRNIPCDFIDLTLLQNFITSLNKNGLMVFIVSSYPSELVANYLYYANIINNVRFFTPEFLSQEVNLHSYDIDTFSQYINYIIYQYNFTNNQIMYLDSSTDIVNYIEKTNSIRNSIELNGGLTSYSVSTMMSQYFNWNYDFILRAMMYYSNPVLSNYFLNVPNNMIPMIMENTNIVTETNNKEKEMVTETNTKEKEMVTEANSKEKEIVIIDQIQFNKLAKSKKTVFKIKLNIRNIERINILDTLDANVKDFLTKHVENLNQKLKIIAKNIEEKETKRKEFEECEHLTRLEEIKRAKEIARIEELEKAQLKQQVEKRKLESELANKLLKERVEQKKKKKADDAKKRAEEEKARKKAEEEDFKMLEEYAKGNAQNKEHKSNYGLTQEKLDVLEHEMLCEEYNKCFKDEIKRNVAKETIITKQQNKIISNKIDQTVESEVKSMVSRLLNQQNIQQGNINVFDKCYDPNKVILPILKYVSDIHNHLNSTQCNFISTMLFDVSLFALINRFSFNPILTTATNIFIQMCKIWNVIEEKVYARELANTSNINTNININIKPRFFHKFMQNIECKEVDPNILDTCHANYAEQKDILMRMLGDVAGITLTCEDTKLRDKYFVIYTNILLLYNVIWCADIPISIEIVKFFGKLDKLV